MNKLALFFCFFLAQITFAQGPKRIVGYVMGSRLDTTQNYQNVEKLTHINYAFADVANGVVKEIRADDEENIPRVVDLKKINPELQILISVGGWTHSGGFSDAALSPESRNRFADSAVEFMKKYELDGIDLDWEYPGQSGNGNPFREEDKQNFTEMLRSIRVKLDSMEQISGNHKLLTIATAAGQKYLDHVELDQIAAFVDFINIMTYDYFGAWSEKTGNHARLYPNTEEAALQHLNAGVPPEKLNIGVAFYGRGWHNVSGLDAKASEQSFSMNYQEIATVLKEDYMENWDDTSMSPYAWNRETRSLIGYDNKRSLQLKAEMIKDLRLGGFMFWEYHGDDGTLLTKLYDELNTLPGHSHNDYEQEDPLRNALRLGMRSIEVDVHLIDDQLYVFHRKPIDLNPQKTLEAMYLKELAALDFYQDPLILLIDVKTDAEETFKKLKEVLAPYRNDRIQFVVSGNRYIDGILKDTTNLMMLDGRPEDLDQKISFEKMPMISQNYKKFFGSKNVEKIKKEEIDAFQKFVDQAHQQGKMVRLWASPDHSEMWNFLMDLGVDLINTDHPEILAEFLKE